MFLLLTMNAINRIGDLAKAVDWPTVLGLFTVIMMGALLIALVFRHQLKKRKLSVKPEDYLIKSKHLPITILDTDTGKTKDMWVNPNDYATFGALYQIGNSMRHGACTDSLGWTQYCLFVAADAFKKVSEAKKKSKAKLSKEQLQQLEEPVYKTVARSMEGLVKPYLRYIGRNLPPNRFDADREIDKIMLDTFTLNPLASK